MEDLAALVDQLRDHYYEATFNEAKLLGGGSFMSTPGPLHLMIDAFEYVEYLLPLVEQARARLARPTAWMWIDACEGATCTAEPVVFERCSRWPKGNDYSGPTTYVTSAGTRQTFAVTDDLRERVATIAIHGKLALVALDGNRIVVAY